ncbi:MAG: FAD:protein FMN transferase [Desulfobacterales bacterium]|nr:MAG: FAD:protein FMN transferase [Desulfobacterales bacterium]
MQKYVYLLTACMMGILLTGFQSKKEHLIAGQTMGTTYHVTVATEYLQSPAGLETRIAKRLNEINRSMSTYRKDSEISRFNALERTGAKFKISDDFLRVMQVAAQVFKLTGGAWDGTVHPLVDLWGFGPSENKRCIPAPEAIAALLPDVGFDHIEIIDTGHLVKKRAGAKLDLSSIAKGYAVDQVAELIRQSGVQDFLVEIGGEIYASGYRPDGQPWRIGINRPQKDAAYDQVYKVVALHNRAFATSGDYRNFFEVEGVRYSHVIDPRTGYPVSNGVVSVSIIADNCTLADGLATAVMVMGRAKGLALVDRLDQVECLIVIEKPDGSLVDLYSKGFTPKN